jgi:glycosyltransferase involved in cell wall biosynthesis
MGRVTAPVAVRVLQVVLSLHPGGTERLVVDIVRRLRDGIPMAVCCLDEAGAWGDALRGDGITVTPLRRTEGFHPTLGREIARVAARHGANVVHAHHYSPFVYAALARMWNRRLGVIYTEHGRLSDDPPSAKRRMANAIFAQLPREVYTVSADLRHHIVAEGFPTTKVGVIYNGIALQPLPDPDERARIRAHLRVTDDTLVIGTIARLDPVKDLPTMLEAMGQVGSGTKAVLVIVGDGSERPALEREVARLGLARAVRFLGHREDARAWLAGCDVYANSSIHEGVSLTILEAMSAALPVVATRVGGTPEIVDGSCGVLVAARDPKALAGALTDLNANPERRKTMGREARQRVEERYTIERMVDEYRSAYLRVGRAEKVKG